MKGLYISTILVALASTSAPSFAQKPIGKCMRPDCASMQQYCEESRSAGKTGTNCVPAGAQCTKTKKWVGTGPDGKKWSCTF
jgi:hypothetical protein